MVISGGSQIGYKDLDHQDGCWFVCAGLRLLKVCKVLILLFFICFAMPEIGVQ